MLNALLKRQEEAAGAGFAACMSQTRQGFARGIGFVYV
jgi:hypothetical protein